MNGNQNPVVRDMAPSGVFFKTMGNQSAAGETPRLARHGMAGGMELDCPERLEHTAPEQHADELKRLYATIADLRERLERLGDKGWLGAGDVVLLRALEQPKTRTELAAATGMSKGYLHVRLQRLRSMGHVEDCGQVNRLGRGKGQGEWIWRKSNNSEIGGCNSVALDYSMNEGGREGVNRA